MTCLAQMAQRAVAGHIAGMVQERSHSAPSNAAALVAPGHEEHQAASTENPVHVEEIALPVVAPNHEKHQAADRAALTENPVHVEKTALPVVAPNHEEHQAADRAASTENPVHVEETALPVVAPNHAEHQAVDCAASMENPVHVEETSLPQPKSVQTPRDSPRVQVPVDLLDNPARIEADIRIDPNFSVWLDSWHIKFNWVYGMSA